MTSRILFVDDEPNVLAGLRRMLRPLASQWDMEFVSSGEEALARLAEAPFDVVVSDMRMPGMDGAQLLSKVRQLYPNVVRIILSGHSEQEAILKSIGPTHQYLAKPCNPDILRDTILRALALSSLLGADSLKKVTSGMNNLPSLPNIFEKLVTELQSPNASLTKVGDIIGQDPGMTAQILRLVNSAYFGLPREITSPATAVNLLGLSTVTSLVLAVHVFKEVDPRLLSDLGLGDLWRHSLGTGTLARMIAQNHSDDKKMGDDAFTAGLIHDIGKLVLGLNFPDSYKKAFARAKLEQIPLWQAEKAEFGASHGEVGAYLVGVWGLPNTIIEPLAFHHHPGDAIAPSFGTLVCVHAANVLNLETEAETSGPPDPGLDMAFLDTVGCGEKVKQWRKSRDELLQSQEAKL